MPAVNQILSDKELLKRLAPRDQFPEKLTRVYGMVRSAIRAQLEEEGADAESKASWVEGAILAYSRVVRVLGQDGVRWDLDFNRASKILVGRRIKPVEAEGDTKEACAADRILRSLFAEDSDEPLNPQDAERIDFLSEFADMSEPLVLETEAAARFV